MTPETILEGLVFAECPRWRDGALYFFLEVPTLPAGLGWLPDGTLQVVSMPDRRVLRQTRQGLVTAADLSSRAAHPANDMVIDAQGRAYIGNFGFDLKGGESPRAIILLRVDAGGEIQTRRHSSSRRRSRRPRPLTTYGRSAPVGGRTLLQSSSSSSAVRAPRRLPVFSVPAGSNSRTCTSRLATGRCSTPRGTIRNSPSLRTTDCSRPASSR
jgi:hypothetical protein